MILISFGNSYGDLAEIGFYLDFYCPLESIFKTHWKIDSSSLNVFNLMQRSKSSYCLNFEEVVYLFLTGLDRTGTQTHRLSPHKLRRIFNKQEEFYLIHALPTQTQKIFPEKKPLRPCSSLPSFTFSIFVSRMSFSLLHF